MDAAGDALPMTGIAHIDALARRLQDCSAQLADSASLDETLAAFKAQVRALFDAEEAHLADADAAVREAQLAEREEFEAFADEVLSAAHFDGVELQRFAMAWCTGHLHSAAPRLRRGG